MLMPGAAVGQRLYEVSDEVARWRNVLVVPYQEYLAAK